ncbi:MAG TPA: hypothetical protein VGA84_12435 [Thermoanaerobaculia bacterium]
MHAQHGRIVSSPVSGVLVRVGAGDAVQLAEVVNKFARTFEKLHDQGATSVTSN